MAENLAALLLNKPLRQPPTQPLIQRDASHLKAFAGRYQSLEGPEIVST